MKVWNSFTSFVFSTPNENEAIYVHKIAFDKLRVGIVVTDKVRLKFLHN